MCSSVFLVGLTGDGQFRAQVAKRIVTAQYIGFTSEPGRTELVVRLPASGD